MGNHIAYMIICLVAHTCYYRQREVGNIHRKVIVIKRDKVCNCPSAPYEHHKIKLLLPLGNSLQSRNDAIGSLISLHWRHKELREEIYSQLILLQVVHKIRIARRSGRRDYCYSGGEQRKRQQSVHLHKPLLLQPLYCALPGKLHLPHRKERVYVRYD